MSKRFFLLVLIILFCGRARAQQKLFLDLRLGSEYGYAESGHFGLGTRPLKGHKFILQFFPSALLRYQVSEKLSLATGYSGGAAGWGYKLTVPDDVTHNDFGGAWNSSANAVYLDRFPLLVEYTARRFNFKPVSDAQGLYQYSVGLSVTGGIGASHLHGFVYNRLQVGPVFLKDTIDFQEQDPVVLRHWGGYATAGITARFYRLGKERLNVALSVQQGFADLLQQQVDYTYNSRRGSQLFRVRGSSLGLAVGIPIRLKTFGTGIAP